MRLRPWSAFWGGVAVLAACADESVVLEPEATDLDERIEQTAKVAADLEASAIVDDASVTMVAGQ